MGGGGWGRGGGSVGRRLLPFLSWPGERLAGVGCGRVGWVDVAVVFTMGARELICASNSD